jgi:hypothetical protein
MHSNQDYKLGLLIVSLLIAFAPRPLIGYGMQGWPRVKLLHQLQSSVDAVCIPMQAAKPASFSFSSRWSIDGHLMQDMTDIAANQEMSHAFQSRLQTWSSYLRKI